MYKNYFKKSIGVFLMLFLVSCTTGGTSENLLETQINEVKYEYAPDKRVALFHVEAIKKNNKYILKGESDLPNAVAALKEKLAVKNIDFIDSIQLLPSPALKGKAQAVINISVANLRSNPKHAAELATQATLGTPVKVLKKEGDWYYIQTPDKYLSWVDGGGIELMDNLRFEQWRATEKIMYTKTYGHSYAGEKEEGIVSDLVAGNVLEIIEDHDDHFKVGYPDGRAAFVSKDDAEGYGSWLKKLDPTVENLVLTSKTLMGVPYLWGGTSTKGMDCSGFTKTIYFLNGMVIPRDASQQVHTGKPIDSLRNFDNLQKGDLLFFGRKATDSTSEKVVHVGMWIGDNEFIHASEMVRISSINKAATNFDEFNLNRYLRSKRILKEQDEELISLLETPLFKD